MKQYVKSRGWLFPLQGGPQDKQLLRLPYLASGENEVQNLPNQIVLDGNTYSKQPKFLVNGDRYMASMGSGKKVEGWVYVYVDPLYCASEIRGG